MINSLLRILNQTLCGTLLGQDILTLDKSDVTHGLWGEWPFQWASYQIRKIAGCACAGNAGNVFPRRRFQRKQLVSDPGMHHGTCVTHVPWCMSGSLTCGDGENVPGIPGACAPAILRIWQEVHSISGLVDHEGGLVLCLWLKSVVHNMEWITNGFNITINQ